MKRLKIRKFDTCYLTLLYMVSWLHTLRTHRTNNNIQAPDSILDCELCWLLVEVDVGTVALYVGLVLLPAHVSHYQDSVTRKMGQLGLTKID